MKSKFSSLSNKLHSSFSSLERQSLQVPVWRRLTAIGLVTAAIVGGLAIDARTESTVGPQRPAASESGASANASSTAWYCPMVFASAANPETGAVAVLNTSSAPVTATLTVAANNGRIVDAPLNVPASARVMVNPGNVVDAQYAGVTVRADGGGLAVEHGITDPNGTSWSPCSVEAATSWHFANGSTDNATTQLALYNPFDEYAIADLVSVTDAGRAEPVQYQGVVIPARGLVTIDLSEQLKRRQWMSTSVEARRGKLVVDQLVGGSLPGVVTAEPVQPTVTGLSMGLGTGLATDWLVTDVGAAPERSERIAVYNPSEGEAELALEVRPDDGEPIDLTMFVPGRGRFVSEVPLEARLAAGAGASVRIRSVNNVAVALTRTTTLSTQTVKGFSLSNPSTSQALRWAMPSSGIGGVGARMWVVNENDQPANLDIVTIGNGQRSAATRQVPPNSRLLLQSSDLPDSTDRAVVFESDRPVTVGREYVNADPAMFSVAPAVALR